MLLRPIYLHPAGVRDGNSRKLNQHLTRSPSFAAAGGAAAGVPSARRVG